MTDSNSKPTSAKGLEGVVALESSICDIDGQIGKLVYGGYEIQDLATHCSFEDVAYLLWNGELPEAHQSEHLRRTLDAERTLPPMVKEVLSMTPEHANPMAVLRTAVSALALFDGEADDASPEANYRKAVRLTAQIPTILAYFDRTRNGLEPQHPLKGHSTATNFLYMLHGKMPIEAAEKAFDTCLVLHAEHGLNASTFAGRVIGATLSDMYSAISGAIGALKGPLHGGANIAVMEMLQQIEQSGKPPKEWVKQKLANKERIMGFGHRVYKTIDPRATILKDMMDRLTREGGDRKWYDMSLEIKEVVEREKGLYPNVDFFSASVYGTLGIPTDLYTPIFAMARITGWTAHLLEQWKENRLIRPRAAYVGPADRKTRRY